MLTTQESQEPQNLQEEFLFDAFISYRHADLDSAAAGYLQKTLEHYKVPRDIQKKCGKTSLKRIFRDEEELGAASDLFREIEQNLKCSEFLLVICTPRLLESKWCMREIETFIRYRGRDNVLAVLVEGEPETAFPPILMEEGEPLATDIRGKNTREVLRRAKQRIPRLVAPLLHCTYDELYQRHRVYRMRRMMAAAGMAAAVSLTFGAVTVHQNLKITENYQGKLENQSKYLAKLSGELLEQGDREASLLVALEALPQGSEDTSRPYVAEARIALENALYTYSLDNSYYLRPLKKLDHKGTLANCFDFDEEENVVLTLDGRANVWDAESGELILCWGDDGNEYTDAKLAAGHRLLVKTLSAVSCVDYRTGRLLWEWTLPDCIDGCSISSSGSLWDYCPATGEILFTTGIVPHIGTDGHSSLLTDRHHLHIIDLVSGQSRTWAPEEFYHVATADRSFDSVYLNDALFSPDGRSVVFTWIDNMADGTMTVRLVVLPLMEDRSIFTLDFPELYSLDHISWLPDGDLIVVEKTAGENPRLLSGTRGLPRSWRLTCWNMKTQTPWFSYEDRSLSLMRRIIVESVPAAEGKAGAHDILSVIYDNVAVNLDRYTGESYGRMEDRSGFILSHIWNSTTQVLITLDGYVFTTVVGDDYVWNPMLSSYHYYLDLDYIPRAEWHGQTAWLFTDTAVYSYTSAVDESGALLGRSPRNTWYNTDHTRLLLQDYNNSLVLYNTVEWGRLWEESILDPGNGVSATLAGGDWAAFLSPEPGEIVFRSLAEEKTVRIPVTELAAGGSQWNLSDAGTARAALWNSVTAPIYKDPAMAALNEAERNTATLWLAEAETGQILHTWTRQELADAVPIPESELPESYVFRIQGVHPTADGRYLLIGGTVVDSIYLPTFEETVLLAWDTAEETWVTLPQEACRGLVCNLTFQTFFEGTHWTAPQDDIAVLLHTGEDGQRIIVTDIAASKILHQWTIDGLGSQEVAFLPDGNHIIFQDSNLCLQIYNWREGRYTSSTITPEKGAMRFEFNNGGDLLSAYTKFATFYSQICSIYTNIGPGEYRKESEIYSCQSCDGNTVVIGDSDLSRLYRYYHLDDLLAQAHEILNGRELTEVERKNYLID